jgi:aryl-phospho-beta-D-glucosidase BglC (GH1 family)
VLAVPASAADRLWVGMHDDPGFRWEPNRAEMLDRAANANVNLIRAIVTWRDVAPTRPRRPADPFAPEYRLDDLDELIRNAQARGMEVLLSIWGTPTWANGGKGPAWMPRRLSDLTNFARAIARRYSGRYPGYPAVNFYSVWNESNLDLFLSPQFDAKGRSVGPRNYAKLYAAAYKGIKAGNPKAKVAIGETSSHGLDHAVKGKSGRHSPGRFAELVAKANPRLKFDAWGHHPYPTPVWMKPTQTVRWPNVTLTSLERFGTSLDRWFKRKNIPIWITEYGHETRPGEPKGVTEAQQARYVKQAFSLVKKAPRVEMFVWFIFQDTKTSTWQSGLYRLNGTAKRARNAFRAAARPLDARNPVVRVKAGRTPVVQLSTRSFGAVNRPGATIGVRWTAQSARTIAATGQYAAKLGRDGWITVRLTGLVPRKGRTYRVNVTAEDYSKNEVYRTVTVIGT